MKPNKVRISSRQLYARTLKLEHFVIQVGKRWWIPEYGRFKLRLGDTCVFHGIVPTAAQVGIVRHLTGTLVGVRILPPTDADDSEKWGTVHEADVVCRLIPYVPPTRFWRLYMTYPGVYGAEINCTIKIDQSKELLMRVRDDLISKAGAETEYKYFIVPIKETTSNV